MVANSHQNCPKIWVQFSQLLQNHSDQLVYSQLKKWAASIVTGSSKIGYNQPAGVRYPTENPWG